MSEEKLDTIIASLDEKTMLEIVETKCAEKGIEDGWIIKEINKNPESFKSVRAIEKLIIEKYVEKISTRGAGFTPAYK